MQILAKNVKDLQVCLFGRRGAWGFSFYHNKKCRSNESNIIRYPNIYFRTLNFKGTRYGAFTKD